MQSLKTSLNHLYEAARPLSDRTDDPLATIGRIVNLSTNILFKKKSQKKVIFKSNRNEKTFKKYTVRNVGHYAPHRFVIKTYIDSETFAKNVSRKHQFTIIIITQFIYNRSECVCMCVCMCLYISINN